MTVWLLVLLADLIKADLREADVHQMSSINGIPILSNGNDLILISHCSVCLSLKW